MRPRRSGFLLGKMEGTADLESSDCVIHSFSQLYSLSTYYVPGPVLGAGNAEGAKNEKQAKASGLQELPSW